MLDMAKVTITRFKEALPGTYGNVSELARKLDCTRQTIYDFFKKRPDMRKLFDEAANELVDRAEWWLAEYLNPVDADGEQKKNDDGSLTKPPFEVVKFVLSTRGKARGWSSRVEVAEAGMPILELDADVRAYLEKIGLGEEDVMSEVAQQFNDIMRAEMEKDVPSPVLSSSGRGEKDMEDEADE